MRTHGWGGTPPLTDDEAVSRILDVAQQELDRRGAALSIADVARALNITRPTLYRYFPSTDHLLTATALRASGPFLEHLTERLNGVTDPADAVNRIFTTVAEELPRNRYLMVALFPQGPHTRLSQLTSPLAVQLSLGLFESLDVDWEAAGFDTALRTELVLHMLRLLQSVLIDSDAGGPEVSPDDLEAYLDRWLRPAVVAVTEKFGTRR